MFKGKTSTKTVTELLKSCDYMNYRYWELNSCIIKKNKNTICI